MKLESPQLPDVTMPMGAPWASKGRAYAAALVVGALVWLLAGYGETVRSLIAIWERSDTFAHGFLIVPISVWLIWRRRHDLRTLPLRPDFRALPLLALAGFAWLLGQVAGAGVVEQYSLVVMIPLLVWTIVGSRVVRALAFPLFFLLFAVPFGEFLLLPMMEHTADAVIFALRLTGIPVYREGLFFTLPSGSWSVVEACSGLRYLIASLTVGFLYAYLMYRSFIRRAIFVAAAIVVPIVANWARAYMIVMIGHLSDMQYAVGVDHLIYGWLFFGVVMMILFWFGSAWREDLQPEPAAPSSIAFAQRAEPSLRPMMAAAIAASVIAAVWPVAAARLDGGSSHVLPALQAPPSAGGWEPIAAPLTDWTPRFVNPTAQLNQTYAKEAVRAGLYIGYYRNQHQGAELITSVNRLVGPNEKWGNTGENARILILDSEKLPSIEAQLRGPATHLLVWRWYHVDGQHTASSYWAKLLQAKSKLVGRGDDGAVVMVYTELDMDREAAAKKLQDFVNAMLPAISRSLDHAR